VVDRPVENVKSCFGYYPLLYHDHRPVPKIRGRGIELLLSLNIAPRFEDTEHKETCLPDLSGQKWEVCRMLGILISEEGFIAHTLYCIHSHASRIYYAFYRSHVKVWRSSRSFHRQPRSSSARSCHSVVQSATQSSQSQSPSPCKVQR
jgi:hypothetical protein